MPRDDSAPSGTGPAIGADLPRPDLRARVAAAAVAAETRPGFPEHYLEQVRETALTFEAPNPDPDDIRAAVAMLEDHALTDPAVPVRSASRAKRAAKQAVRKAVQFQSEYFAGHLGAVAWDTVWIGTAVATRIEELERTVTRLQERIDELERAAGERAPGATPGR